MFHHKELDVGQNFEKTNVIYPGEVKDFSMYPDPSVTDDVWYYSCFAPSEDFVIPVSTERNDERYYFRYDSGSWYYAAQFNEDGTELSMNTYYSYPFPTYANFEFKQESGDEKFSVYLNDEKHDFIQSLDEMGNWHVAFNVEPRTSGQIRITGFDKDYRPDYSEIPLWIKDSASWWVKGSINDEKFVSEIAFLVDEGLVDYEYEEKSDQPKIPQWFRNTAFWWYQGLTTDEDFTSSLKHLLNKGIIQI